MTRCQWLNDQIDTFKRDERIEVVLVICPVAEFIEVTDQIGPRHDVLIITEAHNVECDKLAPGEVWLGVPRPDRLRRWREARADRARTRVVVPRR